MTLQLVSQTTNLVVLLVVMQIAIQGETGSFHDMAANMWTNKPYTIIACKNFEDVFNSVDTGSSSLGIVAIENSLFGSINEVYDLLLKYRLPVIGEIYVPIEQCLIGFRGAKLNEITHIYSHPVALAQCSSYLDKYLPNAERAETFDTAGSVQMIKEMNDPYKVAIASKLAANIYDMKVIEKNIENHHLNFTRFLVIGKKIDDRSDTNKVSLILRTNHEAGALYNALGIFTEDNINITKLQSRPIEGKPFKYMFYIDCQSTRSQFKNITNKLESLGHTVTVLGYYNKGASSY